MFLTVSNCNRLVQKKIESSVNLDENVFYKETWLHWRFCLFLGIKRNREKHHASFKADLFIKYICFK